MEGFCERHRMAYKIVSINGTWYSECPKCREEGLLETCASSHTEMLPRDQWTAAATLGKDIRKEVEESGQKT